ncbi:unnamed protein product [Periconia digitata]|uniref:Cytochrome P450 monooxygenase n=1 Tax=Periconia digitata TaxID=1303443 RepID=A0A9W4U6V9_9PLEO|nr:unnamed protein product [Periconia digitata]
MTGSNSGFRMVGETLWSNIPTIIIVLPFLLYLLYWAALPKPIPGIPYNKNSAKRLLGDVPEFVKEKDGLRFWMRDQFTVHNSPVVQIFTAPFKRPWVLVSDFRESQDMTVRRGSEFDRSGLTYDSFGALAPNSYICKRTDEPMYKHNRSLLKDLMTAPFLNQISAPEIYEKSCALLDLWCVKTNKAEGRPFQADNDVHLAALDVMMAVTFDFPQSDTMVLKQINQIKDQIQPLKLSDGSVEFPHVDLDPELYAWLYLTRSIGVGFQSPVPAFAHWWYLQSRKSRNMIRLKDGMCHRNIKASVERMSDTRADKKNMRCAVDQILLQEKSQAEKRGVEPSYNKKAIYDELFIYIVGGYDTTSITLTWFTKYIAVHQDYQTRLRNEIRSFHTTALAEDRLPSVKEIVNSHIPYLEAFIEETMRCSHIVPAVIRETVADSPVLGHMVPKGTHLWLFSSGPSFMKPAFDINEDVRSETSRQNKDRVGTWSPEDIYKFMPQRWLKKKVDDDGEHEVFDFNAGPHMAFGHGPRSCFGRRLAYLETRIVVTLLVWKFQFLQAGDALDDLTPIDTFMVRPRKSYVRLKEVVP